MTIMDITLDFTAVERAHQQAVSSVFSQKEMITQTALMFIRTLRAGNKVMWCGNGGSAAEAQHMSAELMVRYVKDRQALASIALTNDSSILTAHPNDYDFESVFSRQVEGLGQSGDILVGMTTSGTSKNVLQAFKSAKARGIKVIALTGRDGSALSGLADIILKVDSKETARIQEGHTLINHLICQMLDLAFD